MKNRVSRSSIAAALGLALVIVPASVLAAPMSSSEVTQAELDALQQGQSRSEIIDKLGAPENAPKWLDGSSSLVYEILDPVLGWQRVYVDIDTDGKLLRVQTPMSNSAAESQE
ncbi:hypothetical protein GCM10027046_32840 [Uliginosibacterium flavum]|uniref:PepSY domain-containing protein n=1 Tax=Uliginosibacterium flavum TaxID=1396831 RepID=A0ABV2TSX3_9RHOO